MEKLGLKAEVGVGVELVGGGFLGPAGFASLDHSGVGLRRECKALVVIIIPLLGFLGKKRRV